MHTPDEKLAELGYPLDCVPKPAALYHPVLVEGDMLYASGAIPIDLDHITHRGKVPTVVSVEEAQKVAALCVANNLRMAREVIGSLEKVERVVRLTGYVNSELDFTEQHVVMNGGSQLLIDVFGDAGMGARSAVGAAQLPFGSTVETELILKLRPDR